MRIIRQSEFIALPWKNGGGITHEAIRVPPTGDSFRWRVSLARIDASGPFSDFAAYHRFMVLLKGAGVRLTFPSLEGGGQRRELRAAGEWLQFDGGLATHCDLVDGPCVDFNLMVSKDMPDTAVRVAVLREPLRASLASGESMLAFPIDTRVECCSGGRSELLDPWDLAVVSGRDARDVRISAANDGEPAGDLKILIGVLPAG
jgi:hypothetical protein